jgi:hypothetical protein
LPKVITGVASDEADGANGFAGTVVDVERGKFVEHDRSVAGDFAVALDESAGNLPRRNAADFLAKVRTNPVPPVTIKSLKPLARRQTRTLRIGGDCGG